MRTGIKHEKTAEEKLEQLRADFQKMGRVMLAYSGGVDSTFLLSVAHKVLGDRVLAVTAVSSTYPKDEYETACEMARSMGVKHRVIKTEEMTDPHFATNPPDRCYFCKSELFGKMKRLAEAEGIETILDGTNFEDTADYRPGRIAARECGVRSPLLEAGMTKDEIRKLSRKMGLPTWDQPAQACLASRFPYGESITSGQLNRVEQAEKRLREMGFRELRVRIHGDMARIEIDPERIPDLAGPGQREKILAHFKALGFIYVTLDLQGYRTGSMNETLSPEEKRTG